ncbi:electron transfer flavoprotein subunit alpha/FixB family protein [Afifella marina]|uniref:Electron transfer flavoprotein alpha subunit apoprotein n=1 Tax=Afifella marina DSM 2698 TaxID=1120955 RepID=A0A1G5N6E2_AFIMA|nr:electron transfer flavoprotein subunit alpha/FixB family protein [Afifella marina]MBK1622493.1 electron transfer flavoprotein subunit alpha/FixB family protein [Afifella marina DSM 2698]MBK1626792.1 electron transfer flavoprotein subunit alpha/FixB family protein [Afifella marina]MBK5919278.1 electron transfer flavoprotein subunit alpha [Afifella marina]RAI21316.1 electron transfer flavoprotein subunit alpha [Afifella marina DSM 2698]SCZ32478.1 electron transfer flavoprotein alpha subunit a
MANAPKQQARPAGGRAGMKKELPEHFKAYRHVWVFIEYEHGHVHPVSLELLGEGRKLAEKLDVEVVGVLLGGDKSELEAAATEVYEHGADVLYQVADPMLAHYRNETYTKCLTDLVNTYKPEILLLGATTLGRDLAGSVATTLATGLTADCTELAIDDDRSLAATRPTFGGSLLCTIYTLNFRPQMATVRPRVMAMPKREPGRTGRLIEHPLNMAEEDVVTKVLRFVADRDSNKVQLAFADIVVAGGLGLRSAENFQLVKDLAEVLGAEYGCSRPLVQKGWVPAERQIGQTGKTIRPKLYIAAGISGAIQHRVGVEGADLIVAINSDPNAPIFDFAHLGVVADALEVLPALTRAFAKHLSVNRLAG